MSHLSRVPLVARSRVAALLLAVFLVPGLAGCGGSTPEGAVGGNYTSVNQDGLTFTFSSGGAVSMKAEGLGASTGTFKLDGEKVLVTMDGRTHTFIKDGDCLTDNLQLFGKLCKGGKAGEAANVSTRKMPSPPAGIWVAKNADGEFRLEFKTARTLTLSATPLAGQPHKSDGTYIIESDRIHATLDQGVPLVLQFVNDAFESTSFGLPMRFVKQ